MKKIGNCKLYHGDCVEIMEQLEDETIDCCVTSPPYYGLRDYQIDGQIGLEETPEEYIEKIVVVFREVKRLLKPGGTLWLNLGDSYSGSRMGEGTKNLSNTRKAIPKFNELGKPKRYSPPIGLKPKDLIGIPWMVAFALRADGWYLRQDIIWHKPNPMPESVKDRCTKSHEYIFLFSKSKRYYFDQDAIQEKANYDGRKSTFLNESNKYKNFQVPGKKSNTMASNGHQRWKFKNLKEKGVKNHSIHENRLHSLDKVYATRNKRSVWTIPTKPFLGAHFAVFPPKLITLCIKAGCPAGGMVIDPFNGSGTAGLVALNLQRRYIGIELNAEYFEMSKERLFNAQRQTSIFDLDPNHKT